MNKAVTRMTICALYGTGTALFSCSLLALAYGVIRLLFSFLFAPLPFVRSYRQVQRLGAVVKAYWMYPLTHGQAGFFFLSTFCCLTRSPYFCNSLGFQSEITHLCIIMMQFHSFSCPLHAPLHPLAGHRITLHPACRIQHR